MDLGRLNTGEQIAGASGVLLFVFMYLGWWGGPGVLGISQTLNAWQAADFLDIIWALAAFGGAALALASATQTRTNLPIALSALAAALGIAATVTILFRILDPPFNGSRELGAYLGLLAAAGVAYGAWTAMRDEGTSFSAEAERVQGRRDTS